MRHTTIPLLVGILLGTGLVLGRLTRAQTILGLFDLHAFDPTMLVFWAGALAVLWIARAILGDADDQVPRRAIDRRLVFGAVIFGVGWGLAGLCPGPAVAGLVTFAPRSILFFATMLVGMRLAARRPARAR